MLVTNRNLLGICSRFLLLRLLLVFPRELAAGLPGHVTRADHDASGNLRGAPAILVFGMSEPIGGWIADRLIAAGYSETKVRKGIVTFAFLTGLMLIPAAESARRDRPSRS